MFILTIIILVIAFLLCNNKTAMAHEHPGYSHETSIGYENKNWMSKLKGDIKLSQLSIPGTHETMALYGGDLPQTQTMSLDTQLKSGIRYIDIRCRYIDGVFAIHHGFIFQKVFFGDVLNTAEKFLKNNPTETILMRVKQEYSSESNEIFNKTFMSYVDKAPDLFWDNKGDMYKNPTLDEIRGKIVVLYNVADLKFGLSYSGKLTTQDDYKLNTNWDLYSKWKKVENHLQEANNNPDDDRIYLNHLSGSYGSFPYFVASGHSSHDTGAPRLATGLTTPGWKNSYPDFPRIACFIGICTIAFEGTNVLTTNLINNKNYLRVGIIAADFPGKGLIDSIIKINNMWNTTDPELPRPIKLIENGDFSTGTLNPWESMNENYKIIKSSVLEKNVLQIEEDVIFQEVFLEKNTDYKLTATVRNKNNLGWAFFTISNRKTKHGDFIESTNEFKNVELIFNTQDFHEYSVNIGNIFGDEGDSNELEITNIVLQEI